jgi:hypothetical protein
LLHLLASGSGTKLPRANTSACPQPVEVLRMPKTNLRPLPFSWRDVISIHPAADMLPLLSEEELRELADDIRVNGLRHRAVLIADPVHGEFVNPRSCGSARAA